MILLSIIMASGTKFLTVPVADDLGIGLSTLTRWKRRYREADLLAGPHEDTAKELARLRKENELLRQEREILKRAATFFAKEGSR
jgi:transposase